VKDAHHTCAVVRVNGSLCFRADAGLFFRPASGGRTVPTTKRVRTRRLTMTAKPSPMPHRPPVESAKWMKLFHLRNWHACCSKVPHCPRPLLAFACRLCVGLGLGRTRAGAGTTSTSWAARRVRCGSVDLPPGAAVQRLVSTDSETPFFDRSLLRLLLRASSFLRARLT
jgi:hypothetical protein